MEVVLNSKNIAKIWSLLSVNYYGINTVTLTQNLNI